MMSSIIKFLKGKNAFYFLGTVFLVGIWALAALFIDNEYIIPRISSVGKALGSLLMKGETYSIILGTVFRLLMVVLLCVVLGVTLAVFSCYSQRVEAFVTPAIALFKTAPAVIMAILFIIMLGQTKTPYLITSFVLIPIIYEGVLMGMKNVDKEIVDEIRMDSEITIVIILKIHLLLSLPYLKAVIMQTIGLGLKVMVMAEFLAQKKQTIGYEISFYKTFIMNDYLFAWAVILIALVLIIDIILKKIKKVTF